MTERSPLAAARQPQEHGRILRVTGHPDSLRGIREHVRAHAAALGADDGWVADLVLAVDEACQNIIRHGYGCADPAAAPRAECEIIIETAALPSDAAATEFVVRLTDFAAPVDAAKIRARDLDDLRPGGLGVHFIRALTDDCGWVTPPAGAGNVLRLVKRLGETGTGTGKGETT